MPSTRPRPTPPPLPPFESGPPGDARDAFAKPSPPGRERDESVKAFIQAKWDVLRGDTRIDPRFRALVFADFAKRLRYGADIPPVPGGYGYAAVYLPGFKTAFNGGTSLYWQAICPTKPGGNVSTYLFLTAANRASFGCEALVHYDAQTEAHFSVYDWSKPSDDRWQTDVAFSRLASYLFQQSIQGQIRQTLPIWNSTYEIVDVIEEPAGENAEEIDLESKRRWRNDVLLYNHVESRWDLIYRHDYNASLGNQRGSTIGSWGPDVETFQQYYHGTEDFGTNATMLTAEDSQGQWGKWHLLGPFESEIRDWQQGFFPRFLHPNDRWIVGS
jgi:hypothetical protein